MKFTAYEYAFSQKQLWVGYGNTIIYTLGGTLFGLAISLPCGYALSRRDMEGRGLIMGLITFTMYFNGGLIPTYIVCSALHLTNTRLLLMDEPTNGLDIPAKACFRRVVARQMREDRTIVISTHQVRDVDALLDHVAVVDHSKILLNASTADITSRLVFEQRAAGEDTSDALYAQPNMMGNAIIARNTDGRDSQINLEMLFNALMENNALMEGNEETSLKP